jgi:nucleoside-triphosphatase
VKPVFLLTGRPGAGKTSIIKQAIAESNIDVGGFYTEEIRDEGVRVGFKLVTFDGREAILSHIKFNKRYRVGKYGVDTDILNEVGVTAIQKAAMECDLVVIDEIGHMELLSADFRDTVREIVYGGKRTLGTIMHNANPFADDIKRQPQVNLVTLTRDSYSHVLGDIKEWLAAGISAPPPDQSYP